MALINTIDSGTELIAEFNQWPQRKDQFSGPALCALYEHLYMMSEDLGEDIKLDVVALCCDWTEYNDAKEVLEDHGYSKVKDMSDLQDRTTVIDFGMGLLVAAY